MVYWMISTYILLRITCYIGTGEISANNAVEIPQVYPHFLGWIKAANITQVTGWYYDLPVVGRSLVGFRWSGES